MPDITFTIDSSKQIRGGFADVTRTGDPASVTFVNQSNDDVDVHVVGVAGTRPGLLPNPASGSLLGHGRTVVSVPKNGRLTERLAVKPNRGEYHLTTDRSDASPARGTIRVIGIVFHIDAGGQLRNNEGFDVLQGTDVAVTFSNESDKEVTVFVFPDGRPPSTPSLFRTGGGSPVKVSDDRTKPPRGVDEGKTLPDGIEFLDVPARTAAAGMVEAVIRSDGAVGKFTLSTSYPPCGPTGWINHHM